MDKNDQKSGSKSKYAMQRKNGWSNISKDKKNEIDQFVEGYIEFLSEAKTERLAHDYIVKIAEEDGYKNLDIMSRQKDALKAGDKIYRSYHDRTIALFHIGKKNLEEGLHILGGHIDAPRIDAKPNPLYEDSELALIDTHYYGGIKKYQWVAIPLALHGVVGKSDGSMVSISIGEEEGDPVFTITDLLPHLAKDQVKKTLASGISGEGLNVLIGSFPLENSEVKEKVKEQVLETLNGKYGITEEDFISADLQFVPAGRARELGLDRSMVLGYGQDDRICAYTALQALLKKSDTPDYTSVVLLCDKEEIGSYGATGMQSTFFENSVAEIISRMGSSFEFVSLRRALENSWMISADVTAAHDPNYPDVSSPNNNMAHLGYGPVFSKYTGARGKYGASEASAEFMAKLRKILNDENIIWQSTELGKVDGGGGGTIAHFMARYGMNVVDCGPALLSMHAPWEVSSKIDIYNTWLAYSAFLDKRV